MYSLVIPVYKNEGSLGEVLRTVEAMQQTLADKLEVIFVVDGSPDNSSAWLHANLPSCSISSKVIELSRNFGSFSAIRAGLSVASGSFFAVMAADLQEPPSLIVEMFRVLAQGGCDVAIATRESRDDPQLSKICSAVFWGLYKRLVQPEMPQGGVDVFGCNREFRNQLVSLPESNSSLVGLVLWVGFRRAFIPYIRVRRQVGKSAWTFSKKLRYLLNSVFSFSDLPIQVLLLFGLVGFSVAAFLSLLVFGARVTGLVNVPGYSATVLVILFFAALNSLGLGIIGSYTWRAFENTKHRPLAIVMKETCYEGRGRGDD